MKEDYSFRSSGTQEQTIDTIRIFVMKITLEMVCNKEIGKESRY